MRTVDPKVKKRKYHEFTEEYKKEMAKDDAKSSRILFFGAILGYVLVILTSFLGIVPDKIIEKDSWEFFLDVKSCKYEFSKIVIWYIYPLLGWMLGFFGFPWLARVGNVGKKDWNAPMDPMLALLTCFFMGLVTIVGVIVCAIYECEKLFIMVPFCPGMGMLATLVSATKKGHSDYKEAYKIKSQNSFFYIIAIYIVVYLSVLILYDFLDRNTHWHFLTISLSVVSFLPLLSLAGYLPLLWTVKVNDVENTFTIIKLFKKRVVYYDDIEKCIVKKASIYLKLYDKDKMINIARFMDMNSSYLYKTVCEHGIPFYEIICNEEIPIYADGNVHFSIDTKKLTDEQKKKVFSKKGLKLASN